jgi:hypothetical protein
MTAKRTRPNIPTSYGIPQTEEGMVSWDWVMAQVEKPRNYWVATVTPDGKPHTIPVWGVWVDGVFYHGGGPDTRRGRNLTHNPHMVLHLESGDQVVIIEGRAEILTVETIDPDLASRIDAEYVKKYGMEHGLPVWRLKPHKVLAWHEYPTTVTRWVFEDDGSDS